MSRVNRREIFDPTEVGVYHCIHRTVRRARLCGRDDLSKRSYDHRKWWIEDQLINLSSIFAFDMLSYAVMDNHLHLVTRNRPDVLREWTGQDVLNRWWRLCPKRREADGSPAIATEADLAFLLAEHSEECYRDRLGSISWLMRYLAEPIARRANREDDCTGHFWEGRFKCQRLLDEAGLLACCAYVDLNPIRAGIVKLPETYQHTSIFKRITAQIEEAALLTGSQAGSTDLDEECGQLPALETEALHEIPIPVAEDSGIDAECVAMFAGNHEPGNKFMPQGTADERIIDGSNANSDMFPDQSNAVSLEPLAATQVFQPEPLSGRVEIEAEDKVIGVDIAKSRGASANMVRANVDVMLSSRTDAWLAPVELDPRASAYAGPMPSTEKTRASDKGFLHMTAETYIKLIDWLGRQVRGDRGVIPAAALPILERIGLSPDDFCDFVQRFGKIFKQAAGAPAALAKEASRRNQRWMQCNNSPLRDVIPVPATG